MRDPERIPLLLAAIERQWRRHPDMRLGQLLVNLIRARTGSGDAEALFALQDGKLLEWLGPDTVAEASYVDREPAEAAKGWAEWRCTRVQQMNGSRRLIELGQRLDDIEMAINDVHREADDDETRSLIASLMTDVQRARLAACSIDPVALGMRAEPGTRLWIGRAPAPSGWRQVTRFHDATRPLADGVVELALAGDLDEQGRWGVHVVEWLGGQQRHFGRGVWPRDGIVVAETRADKRAELARAIEEHAGRELQVRRWVTPEKHERFSFDWNTFGDTAGSGSARDE